MVTRCAGVATGPGCNLIGPDCLEIWRRREKGSKTRYLQRYRHFLEIRGLAEVGLLRCCVEWTRTCSWTQSMATFLEAKRVVGEGTVAVLCCAELCHSESCPPWPHEQPASCRQLQAVETVPHWHTETLLVAVLYSPPSVAGQSQQSSTGLEGLCYQLFLLWATLSTTWLSTPHTTLKSISHKSPSCLLFELIGQCYWSFPGVLPWHMQFIHSMEHIAVTLLQHNGLFNKTLQQPTTLKGAAQDLHVDRMDSFRMYVWASGKREREWYCIAWSMPFCLVFLSIRSR